MALFVTPAIPASHIVQVFPSVLPAGGNALDLITIFLTQNPRVPNGQVLTFPTATAVGSYFGALATETALATIYFSGYDNKTATPGAALFWRYNEAAAGAWMRGGSLAGLTLTGLQAISGTLAVTIDSTPHSTSINLAAATSFSNAGLIIAQNLGIAGPQVAQMNASITGTVMTVPGPPSSGTLGVGDTISGSGVTSGTYITSLGTGTGGAGTYNVTPSQTVASGFYTAFSPAVQYDSVQNNFVVYSGTTGVTSTLAFATGTTAALLALTQATGAILSQGVVASTPAGDMTAISAKTQNWAVFMAVWDTSQAENIAFSDWCNGQNNRYLFVMWTSDITNTEIGGPSADVAEITASNNSGTCIVWDDLTIDPIGGEIAALVCGYVGSLNFSQTNGRTTAAFRTQAGLTPEVTSGTAVGYLEGYGLNYYGDFTTANQAFLWLYPGTVTGPFQWLDSYVNQIWFNAQLQLAGMELLGNSNSIPFNAAGAGAIRAAMLDPILQALNFGVIRTGVTLSQAQINEIESQAGTGTATVLSTAGYYLSVVIPSPQVRQARGPWPITLYYTDGQSLQQISITSVLVQ